MPVVSTVSKIDLASNTKIEETYYTHSQDNNFTGYPMYSLSNNSDNLIDSQNQAYRYSVEISSSDLVGDLPQTNTKVHYYNYLHLPIEVVTKKNGFPHSKTTYEYAISPFKYSRSTNYDKPRETTNWTWHDGHKSFIPGDKILTNYDTYGNKIEEHLHIYDRTSSKWKVTHSQTKSYYNDAFGLEKENIRKDGFTGQMIRTSYTLAADKKTHTDKIVEYKTHGDTDWKPWQKFTLKHDPAGRKTVSSVEWLAKDKPGPQKTFYTKDYHLDSDTGHLTIKQTSTLGAVHTEIQDTLSGNLIKKITPEGAIWQYEYDPLKRLTKETNPLGKATVYTHHDYGKDKTNQIIKQTPLQYTIAQVTDATGRIIEHKDLYHDAWRRLSTQEYNGWGKVIKQTNILGLENTIMYDQLERPIKHIDHWGNIKQIEYNDADLITTTYLNKHKVMEKETQPWLAKTRHRKYPLFDNPHDRQTGFLEETLEKNGFGRPVHYTSSMINHLTGKSTDTIQSIYEYDPGFNRTSKTINGFNNLHYTRLTEYDIFKNVVKHTKKQNNCNKTSHRDTDQRVFNADNQLISVVTPQKMTTQYINDKEGRRIKTIQPDGETILYEYNLLGQMTKNSWMRNGKPIEITKTYNSDNHLTSLSDNDGQIINYSYLPNGRIHTITYPDKKSLTMDYDDKERIISRTDFANKRYLYTYNADDKGLISAVQLDKHRIHFKYGEDENKFKGKLITRTSIYNTDDITETHFYYGPFKNIAKTCHSNKPSGITFNTDYHFNVRGQLTGITNHSHKGYKPASDSSQSYQYDALNRLVNEKHHTNQRLKYINYHYDANNNLIDEIYHDEQNHHSTSHEYNAQDQRICSTSDTGKETYTDHYIWNKNGHLEKTPDNTTYDYDAQGYLLKINSPHSSDIEYHYLPNGLLSKRTTGHKQQSFYHGINKKITAIKNDDQWHSLYSDSRGLQANISDNSVDQFFVSGHSIGGILSGNQDFHPTSYSAYGKTSAPLSGSEISSSLGWNQEYTDQDAQLTYLQRRFYNPGLQMFISRDNYFVDNPYAFAKVNPVTFIDPTGHSVSSALNYTLGGALAVLGVIGIVAAVPTGGASLTLTAGAAVAGATATTLAGLSTISSQAAFDAGSTKAGEALQYTTFSLIAVSAIAGGVALAPSISASFFSGTTSALSEGATEEIALVDRAVSSGTISVNFSAGSSVETLEANAQASTSQAFYDTVETHLTSSGESQVSIQSSASSVSDSRGFVSKDLGETIKNLQSNAPPKGYFARLVPTVRYEVHAGEIYSVAGKPQIAFIRINPSQLASSLPVTPGAFPTEESINFGTSGVLAPTSPASFEDISGTDNFQGLDRSSFEEAYPNGTD